MREPGRKARRAGVLHGLALTTLLIACASGAPRASNPAGDVAGSILPGESTAPAAELVVQLTNAWDITSMELSPDGNLLATGSWDRSVRLWDAHTGQELRRMVGHCAERDQCKVDLAFSPDSRLLASAAEDHSARLWDVASGREVLLLRHEAEQIDAVAFSPTEDLVATAARDGLVRLWSIANGEVRGVLRPASDAIDAVAFSRNGRHLLVASGTAAELWDTEPPRLIATLDGHSRGVTSVAFSPRGDFVVTGSADGSARAWSTSGREILKLTVPADSPVNAVDVSADGTVVVTASEDGTARLWDARNGALVRSFETTTKRLAAAAMSPDQAVLYTAGERSVRAWKVADGTPSTIFDGNSSVTSSAAEGPEASALLIGNWNRGACLWDQHSGVQTHCFAGHRDDVRAVAIAPRGDLAVTASRDGTARLWDLRRGSELRVLDPPGSSPEYGLRTALFSPGGDTVVTAGDDGMVHVWKTATGEHVRGFGVSGERITSAALSRDGAALLTASGPQLRLWNLLQQRDARTLPAHQGMVRAVSLSPDGRFALSACAKGELRLWDLGRNVAAWSRSFTSGLTAAAFSPNGAAILVGSDDGVLHLVDAASGAEIRSFAGHAAWVYSAAFLARGDIAITTSADQTTRLWRVDSGEELCRMVSFRDGTWAVVDAEGRFDASNGGDVRGMHWVVGLEAIELEQLKERYYEPGLLAKKLGLNDEPMREVAALSAPELFPRVSIAPLDARDPRLRIRLENRGGGIGRVVVAINGKEIAADARGPGIDPQAQRVDLPPIPLAGSPLLLPGQTNTIEVRTYNADGYLASRGVEIAYIPPGSPPTGPHRLRAIVVGISDYAGSRLDLTFAAKDARNFAGALEIAGAQLFGAENVDLTLIAADSASAPGAATKADITAAFARLRAAAPSDIVVVYLAGHGVAVGDTYYYLTRAARSANFTDPAVRDAVTVSSLELIEWLKVAPPLKQVLVLDTCAAGAAAAALSDKREVSADQIRAIERLKDRVGFHVLMGSAADAVSYETSRYEQGLLTYALLAGMRGAALREERYVDVSRLFQHAADEVPLLAQDIGGIQQPRIAAPRGTSFDIGLLDEASRRRIPLASPKPMLLRSMFINRSEQIDDLDLSARVNELLRRRGGAISTGEAGSRSAVFIDADRFPGAVQATGTYVSRDGVVGADFALARDGIRVSTGRVSASLSDLDALSLRLVEAILAAARAGDAPTDPP